MNDTTIDMNAKKNLDFEQSLATLEDLVERLETGELPLEEALQTFEQGIKLTRQCQNSLDKAQQKVQQLLADSDDLTLQDFEAEDSPHAE